MTTILAIETATPACSAALLHDGQVSERFEIAPRRHTDLILPMIDALLTERGVGKVQIDAIAFGCGPGSFMGTRLATGIAQGLGYALDCPLIPLSTLQIVAQTVYQQHVCEQPLLVGWDARMDEVYWALYQAQDGLMENVSADTLTKPQAIAAPSGPYALAGNAWSIYKKDFDERLLAQASQLIIDCYPHAAGMLRLAAARLKAGTIAFADTVEPVYLRQSITS